MNRRDFLWASALGGASLILPVRTAGAGQRTDVVIVGGGLGGCAAALPALRRGKRVVLTEETDWIGGQLTQQGVPPDEHRWIESFGCTRTYRELRNRIREYYRAHYPLTESARSKAALNPGNGSVSRLCHEPRAALAVLESWLMPYRSSGQLVLLTRHRVESADVQGDRVRAVRVKNLESGAEIELSGHVFVDATELGDLLPLAGAEFVTGAESRAVTGELHGAEKEDPANQQAFTVCFAMEYRPGTNQAGDRPAEYEFWREFVPNLNPPWPGKLLDFSYSHPPTLKPRRLGFNPSGAPEPGTLNLWTYRRILDAAQFRPEAGMVDISLVNWPQNDYLLGNLAGVSSEERQRQIARAKQLSLSLLYWLQTEAPRPDGGQGFPGLGLRRDVMGTEDGLAKFPYVRESRRIRSVFTVIESHVGLEARMAETGKAAGEVKSMDYFDSVGIGQYHIDLHPSPAGNNYIDFPALPFQIPLGALLPVRVVNLIPACKNIGTTHVTNGCYRLHPVEWNIGEAAGHLASFASDRDAPVQAVRSRREWLEDFQRELVEAGVELKWPDSVFVEFGR